ncbi:MAG: ATP-binding protein, partial [Candidatus Thorarchaeota archaeon]
MPEEKTTGIGVTLTKLCIVLMATLLPSSVSLWLLSIVPFGLAQLKAQAFLLSGVCFFIGSSALIFSTPSKNKGLIWLSGFVISLGALVIGGIIAFFQLAALFPLETLAITCVPIVFLLVFYSQRVASTEQASPSIPQAPGIVISRRIVKKEHLIGAVELTEFPEEHLLGKDSDSSDQQSFHNILRVMVLANFPIALRYERVRKRMRVLYLTWAKDELKLSENLETLADTVKGNLRGFKQRLHPRFHGPTISPLATPVTTYLLGEPLSVNDTRQSTDVMNVMAEVLLGLSGGIIQFTVIPKRSSSRALKSLENQYRDESERAQLTISKPRSTIFSGEVQESKTRTDMGAVKKAESLKIQIERLSNTHLCEVEVSATCWDRDPAIAERHSKKLMDVLKGTLVPADPQKHLTLEIRKNVHEAKRLIEGETIGKTSLLSLDEASVYFSLARKDLGVPIADHASFITNPADLRPSQDQGSEDGSPMKSKALHLGQKLDDSGNPHGEFTVPIIDLASHTVVGGDTGTGKTVTQSNLALELDRLHIPFLIIVASKHEDQLRFIRKVKGIQVFTPGDETTTPVRFSFSDFCEGMHVNSVINDAKAMFVATMPSQGIIKEYMEKVIELTCLRLGWDRETNTPGLPILFSDFTETLPLIKDEIHYSTRGNEDVWGALWGRYGTLYPSVLSSMFNTITGMTVDELVSKPTILILDRLSLEEQMFLVYWLVTRIARFFEAKKKTDVHDQRGLKYVVFMEEAQRFFSGGTGIKVDEDHGVRYAAVDAITAIMKESRSAGLGFCLIAPSLSELTHNACNMALNIMMHRKGPKNDREQIGGQMNCTDDQIRLIGSLPIGEAVVRTANIGKPVRVRLNNPVEMYPELASDKPVTD